MRAEVLKFEQINEYLLLSFLYHQSTNHHFKNISSFYKQCPGSWATQVEVVTVATMFQVPVYYYKSSQDGVYHWEVTNPLKCNSASGNEERCLDADVFYMECHTTLNLCIGTGQISL